MLIQFLVVLNLILLSINSELNVTHILSFFISILIVNNLLRAVR